MQAKGRFFLGAAIQEERLPLFRIRHTLLTGLVLSSFTSLAYAQCGELAHDFRCMPRILPGAPGVYEVVTGVANATPDVIPNCGSNVGHTVWFKVTPTVDSVLTFTTCHPATTYDTVLQVYGPSCIFTIPLIDLCSDNFPDVASCSGGCLPFPLFGGGSKVSFQANANQQYLFQGNRSAICNA